MLCVFFHFDTSVAFESVIKSVEIITIKYKYICVLSLFYILRAAQGNCSIVIGQFVVSITKARVRHIKIQL